jgi:hypothetical protein
MVREFVLYSNQCGKIYRLTKRKTSKTRATAILRVRIFSATNGQHIKKYRSPLTSTVRYVLESKSIDSSGVVNGAI